MIREPNIAEMLKNELIALKINTANEKKSFLVGAIVGIGFLYKSNRSSGIILESTQFEFIEKCVDLIEEATQENIKFFKKEIEANLGYKITYVIELNSAQSDKLLSYVKLLANINVEDSLVDLNIGNFKNDKAKVAFLQALYLGTGSIYAADHQKELSTGYSLEFNLKSGTTSSNIIKIFEQLNINTKLRKFNNMINIYMKDAENILDFLATLKAVNTFFRLQNMLAWRSISNKINRERNCLFANINKTTTAASKQILAIYTLMNSNKFNALSNNLKDAALLRLEHPEASLEELAELAQNTTKSGISHRLKKIITLSEID